MRKKKNTKEEAISRRLIKSIESNNCTDCKLSNNNPSNNRMDGIGTDTPEVLIVTEFSSHPAKAASAHTHIRRALADNEVKLSTVRYTGALRCPKPHMKLELLNDYAVKTYIRGCRENLQDEIKALSPKVVVLLGNTALNAALPTRSGIAKYAGSIFQYDDITYLVTYDPKFNETFHLFKKHMTKVPLALKEELIEPDTDYKIIKDDRELAIAEKILSSVDAFAFDFEVDCQLVNGAFAEEDKLLSIAFCWEDKKGICIPLDHKDSPFNGVPQAHAAVKRILTNNVEKIAHNGVFDCHVAHHFYAGLKVKNFAFDTLLAHHLIDPTRGTHSLKYLATIHTNFGGYEEKVAEILSKLPRAERTYGKIPIDLLTFYNCIDTDVTWRLYNMFKLELQRKNLYTFFKDITMPTHETVLDMKIRGIYVNTDVLDALQVQYTNDVKDTLSALMNLKVLRTMPNINLNSTAQLKELLYKKYKFPVVKKTSTDNPSTDAMTLAMLKKKVEKDSEAWQFLNLFTKYKKLTKLQTTYIERYRENIIDGYIFTNYLIFGTETGRLSCVKGDTLVQTRKGLVEMQDIRVGDEVATHKGRYRKVLKEIFKGHDTMVTVTMDNGESLTCTSSHKLLLKDGSWKTVEEIATAAIKPLLAGYNNKDSVRIESISAAGTYGVYDITVEEDHTYLAAGIYSHNSNSPNLQQIPSEYDQSKLKVKSMFEAPEGFNFVELDFSQVELRNLANVTGDEALINAYNSGEDIHAATAKNLFNTEDITDQQRQLGKTINFGSVYGAGPKRLAAIIDSSGLLSQDELIEYFSHFVDEAPISTQRRLPKEIIICRGLLEAFYSQYPEIRKWQNKVIDATQKSMWVQSPFGRRRHIKYPANLKSLSNSELANLNNQSINFPIQSVSSDCLLLSINAIHKYLTANCNSTVVGTVHDSILFYIDKQEQEALLPKLIKLMEDAPYEYAPNFFKVKLIADAAVGPSWGDLKEAVVQ